MSRRTLNLDDQLYDYVSNTSLREHPAQSALRAKTASMSNAGMQISPEQGQFMGLLIKVLGAKRTIEVGVFTGYSALSVALALPADGQILACDVSEDYVSIGRPFWESAGVSGKIHVEIAPAAQTLKKHLANGEAGSYDFAFIDADKASYDTYYECCLELVRPGGLIALDNVLWGGAVAQPGRDEDTLALQALNIKLHADRRIDLSLLPLGDGLTLALKR